MYRAHRWWRRPVLRDTAVSVGTGHVVTLEGLSPPDGLHPLQQAFVDEQAVQCGYCINGMIMQAASLLQQTPHPSENDVRQALANNLCRCGTHLRILRAIMHAASA
jgi:nicotinate dehydrogenase subunit A